MHSEETQSKLEIIATSLESATVAQGSGADRLEVVSMLRQGGVTPGIGLVKSIFRSVSLPLYVMVRPRDGDFVFSGDEISVMEEEIYSLRGMARGIVVGANTPGGQVDQSAMTKFMAAAEGMEVTFHRAFDFTADPIESLHVLMDLGVNRILTSGQAPSADKGMDLLKRLTDESAGRIGIVAGGGVTPGNIPELYHQAGIREFHMSALKVIPSPVTGDVHERIFAGREEGLSNRMTVDAELISDARRILDGLWGTR